MISDSRCPTHGRILLDFDSEGKKLQRPRCYACLYLTLPSIRRDWLKTEAA